MVVLIACDNPRVNEYFAVKIVGEGIEPHKADNKQELFEQLEKRNIDVLIIDIEAEVFEGIQTIKEIKAYYNQTIILVLTYKTGLDFAKKMQEMEVHGFISKTEEFENQINKTLILLDGLKTRRKEQRKFMRVKPDDSQINDLSLSIPGLNKEYKGKIKDISLGGLAASMDTNILDSLLYTGVRVEVSFQLNKIRITSEAQVVAKRSNDVAVSYRNMSPLNRKKLSEYIISRIE